MGGRRRKDRFLGGGKEGARGGRKVAGTGNNIRRWEKFSWTWVRSGGDTKPHNCAAGYDKW